MAVYSAMPYAGGNFNNAGGVPVNNISRWGIPTGIQPVNNQIPKEYSLHQNYPNPFNPVTKIRFDLPESGSTSLKVYDNLGGEIAVILKQEMNKGSYELSFDASNLSTGVYYYELKSGNYRETKKMILVK
jgi:hypothetical protein